MKTTLFSSNGLFRLNILKIKPNMFLYITILVLLLGLTVESHYVSSPFGLNNNSHEQRKLEFSGFGPNVKATQGQPWPMPQKLLTYGDLFMVVRPSKFIFDIVGPTCDMIDAALKRYYSIIVQHQRALDKSFGKFQEKLWKEEIGFRGYLDVLSIVQEDACEYLPHDDMDESYKLIVDTEDYPRAAILKAKSNWGILRGLETFTQLLHHKHGNVALRIRSTWIHDYPRFKFRSVLLDSGRHFLSLHVLKRNLDLMAMNKMNVFHWHIVDDQSFPYESRIFPQLSEKGSYNYRTHVYTQEDIKELIEYARVRGIRIIPEFDTPGHTLSWGPGVPGLLTQCYKGEKPRNSFGPINPIVLKNYEFLKIFFSEVSKIFPDQFMHLGGDEVDFSCWKSNPDIQKFMRYKNWTEYEKLEEFYVQNLLSIVGSFTPKKSYILWQEVFDHGAKVDKETIFNVWKHEGFQSEMKNVTMKGYRVILYACWYLDIISWSIDWPKYYDCDPLNFNATRIEQQQVLGGGAALWGEFVDSTNVLQRLWPRASAPAERLWSPQSVTDKEDAARRLEEHRCRLLTRGYPVQPSNGPGFCPLPWDYQ